MLFSFTINGNDVNPFDLGAFSNSRRTSNQYSNDTNQVSLNQYQMEYVKRYGYPRNVVDRMKMRDYEKSLKEMVIIDNVEIINDCEKNIVEDTVVMTSNISGNQV